MCSIVARRGRGVVRCEPQSRAEKY